MKACATGCSRVSVASVTTFGSKPNSLSTSRAIFTVIATGKMAMGWGFMIAGLPVARLANSAGCEFHVGKEAQQITSARPRGMIV